MDSLVERRPGRPSPGPPPDVAPAPAIEPESTPAPDTTREPTANLDLSTLPPPDPGERVVRLPAAGTFTSSVTCAAVVHRNYDQQNSNWTAAVTLGLLDEPLRESGDLRTIASQTFASVVVQNYSTKFTLKKQKTEQLRDIAPDGQALLVSADVHVSVKGLPTKYDRLVLAVIELESGPHVAWYGVQANDSPKDVVKALKDSAQTFNARK